MLSKSLRFVKTNRSRKAQLCRIELRTFSEVTPESGASKSSLEARVDAFKAFMIKDRIFDVKIPLINKKIHIPIQLYVIGSIVFGK
jgi:hypothetical protein